MCNTPRRLQFHGRYSHHCLMSVTLLAICTGFAEPATCVIILFQLRLSHQKHCSYCNSIFLMRSTVRLKNDDSCQHSFSLYPCRFCWKYGLIASPPHNYGSCCTVVTVRSVATCSRSQVSRPERFGKPMSSRDFDLASPNPLLESNVAALIIRMEFWVPYHHSIKNSCSNY